MKNLENLIPIKILAIDDKLENLMALKAALDGYGYELIQSQVGKDALELIKHHEFAAILLDVQMPVMNGFETALEIRKKFPDHSIPILFLTAIDRTEENEKLGYVAGAVDYLFKPLNIDILRAKLGIFAELFRRNKENQMQAELLKEAALREQENLLLKEAVLVRDEFLSMAAHELKTPITPLNLQMQAFIQMYRDGSVNSIPVETLLRLLKTSQSQIDRLSKLISELVDVSSIKAGKLKLLPEIVNLAQITESIVLSFSEELKRVGCVTTLNCEPETIGHWDRFRIEQAIINLLTNSIKYAAGSPIEIKVYKKEDKAYFAIRDYGIGIAEEDHKRIFERFERAVSSRNFGGLGLGLFIACRIVRLHHGDLTVESSLGSGAKFEIDLPLQPSWH